MGATIGALVERKLMKPGDRFGYIPGEWKYTTNPDNTGCEALELGTKDNWRDVESRLDWNVLNTYPDGDIDVIRDSLLPFFCGRIALRGITGYLKGSKEINQICKALFGNPKYGAKARSVTLEEIMKRYGEKMKSHKRRAYYSPLFNSVWGGKKTFNGVKYEKKECLQTGFIYNPDGGGQIVADKRGFNWHIPDKDNPVYVTESGFNYYIPGIDVNGGWIPAQVTWFDEFPNKRNLIGGDVCYGINVANSVMITQKVLFNSSGNAFEQKQGVYPVIHISGENEVDYDSVNLAVGPGSGWRPEYVSVFTFSK